MKNNIHDLIRIMLEDGEILESKIRGNRTYVIVKYSGKTYWIDNPYGKIPKIT